VVADRRDAVLAWRGGGAGGGGGRLMAKRCLAGGKITHWAIIASSLEVL
jgi:hypothetical protein